MPPVVSAIKQNGTPLYKLHRKGVIVSPEPRTIEVKRIEVIDISFPYVDFRVECSKGTYIRAICRDIGDKLGCGGTQAALKRTRVGDFTIEHTATIEDLEQQGMERYLISVKR